MNNEELAAVFKRIARLLEIKGENPYKIRAYRRAAEALQNLPTPAAQLRAEGRLTEIPGVGEAIAKKIAELLDTGRLAFLERLEKEMPPGLLELTALPGLGPKKVRRLWQELGITDVDALEAAAQYHRLRDLPGFGAKTEAQLLAAIAARRAQPTGYLLGEAYPLAQRLLARLREMPGVAQAELAGSTRRGKAMVGDVDLLLATDTPRQTLEAVRALWPAAAEITGSATEAEVSAPAVEGVPVHVLAATPPRFGTAWVLSTGSAAHRAALQARAQALGRPADAPFPTEEAFYQALGLTWIPPELRENQGEIEAAAQALLPRLVQQGDCRAELHSHTQWSDGHASIREMAEAAIARGLKVLAITDHTQSLGIAHGLTPERLRAQRAEIRQVQAQLGDRIVLLQGAEVEILADGRLDYPDDVLAELDVVIASLHTALRQPREQITARLLKAMSNRYVHIIAHPSGRLLPHRPGADLDWPAVLAAAAEHGLALEINAHPRRLDLTDQLVRQAVERGIPLALNTDAHRPADFDQRFYGLLTARRGWAQAPHIINTWPTDRLLAWLRQKRA